LLYTEVEVQNVEPLQKIKIDKRLLLTGGPCRVGSFGDSFDFTGLDAAGADLHSLGTLRGFRMDSLQIGEEAAFGQIVSVAFAVTGHGSFTANITYARHNRLGLYS